MHKEFWWGAPYGTPSCISEKNNVSLTLIQMVLRLAVSMAVDGSVLGSCPVGVSSLRSCYNSTSEQTYCAQNHAHTKYNITVEAAGLCQSISN
jgi:hypothetical protein